MASDGAKKSSQAQIRYQGRRTRSANARKDLRQSKRTIVSEPLQRPAQEASEQKGNVKRNKNVTTVGLAPTLRRMADLISDDLEGLP